MTVTVGLSHLDLDKIGACFEAREWFARTYVDASVPLAQVLRAAADHGRGTEWVRWYCVCGHMPKAARAVYQVAIASADAAHREAIASADAAHREAIASADAAYREAGRAAIIAAAVALESVEDVTA